MHPVGPGLSVQHLYITTCHIVSCTLDCLHKRAREPVQCADNTHPALLSSAHNRTIAGQHTCAAHAQTHDSTHISTRAHTCRVLRAGAGRSRLLRCAWCRRRRSSSCGQHWRKLQHAGRQPGGEGLERGSFCGVSTEFLRSFLTGGRRKGGCGKRAVMGRWLESCERWSADCVVWTMAGCAAFEHPGCCVVPAAGLRGSVSSAGGTQRGGADAPALSSELNFGHTCCDTCAKDDHQYLWQQPACALEQT